LENAPDKKHIFFLNDVKTGLGNWKFLDF